MCLSTMVSMLCCSGCYVCLKGRGGSCCWGLHLDELSKVKEHKVGSVAVT